MTLSTVLVLLFLLLIMVLLSSVIIELLKIRRTVQSIEQLTRGSASGNPKPRKPGDAVP